jgi:hypothetical protein
MLHRFLGIMEFEKKKRMAQTKDPKDDQYKASDKRIAYEKRKFPLCTKWRDYMGQPSSIIF